MKLHQETPRERRNRLQREARARRRVAEGGPTWPCPECGVLKWTADTVQAHRAIAHGIGPSGPARPGPIL